MEYLETECDYLTEGTIYDFSLDLLTKSLTLKVSTQMYDPEKKYIEEEFEKIVLEYYELKLTGIKRLYLNRLENLSIYSDFTLENIGVWKFKDKDDIYKVRMDVRILGSPEVICKKYKVTKILENEMDYEKAYEY